MVRAVEDGRRSGRPLRHAAARAALWFLHDFPASMEIMLFPDNIRAPVHNTLLRTLMLYLHAA